jgi:hypothetical protein
MREGSGVATCPEAPGPPPGGGGLRCFHVSHGSRPASQCKRALVSPCAPWHWVRHPAGKGSGVTTCHEAPNPPLGAGGLWHCHVPCGSQPPRHACAFPRRLTLGSSWPHQAHRAGSALNAYRTSHTRRMTSIKCIQDIDIAERRQYGADLLVTHNGQSTVQGDSTTLCNEAATVPA